MKAIQKKKPAATAKSRAPKREVPADVTIVPELDGKYDNQPLFQDKLNRVNYILKTVGMPKFS
ncbi:MAG TPA: hypothetical protein VFO93_01240 [Hymenobacter sp.]|uniref:hypothetical protein n=1 Tax=Hymenobacter sp. TaxID=1898978 RepID=UPI002D7E98BE|nr:hypothetical protein [Hymenobacter sp.]HET9502134.1 hypothetical protein [Hymenobacter sp.]